MPNSYIVLLFIVVMTVGADYALKVASGRTSPFLSAWFLYGAALYAVTAAGWIILMQSHSLAQIGVLYSSATIVALTGLGYLLFGESLSTRQIVGVAAALIAVVLVEH
ncbi:transporter [Rhodovulum steppense]|uniref:EamA-like transporter family protein n=1 Tax=Rhodovulum steppense TaxID=540251 RepID=A0A4R1YI13_9RHOB|nr:transporter [Rhodovulum steppense]TCM75896.1 hypothetical protein EV216_13624 [Rhodovulum steppense]